LSVFFLLGFQISQAFLLFPQCQLGEQFAFLPVFGFWGKQGALLVLLVIGRLIG
jgi:hypothetical protein